MSPALKRWHCRLQGESSLLTTSWSDEVDRPAEGGRWLPPLTFSTRAGRAHHEHSLGAPAPRLEASVSARVAALAERERFPLTTYWSESTVSS